MGNHFRYNLSFWDVGIFFFYWTGLSNFCQSRRVHAHMLVLIGHASVQSESVSPFPFPQKLMNNGSNKERQEVGMLIHMKGNTFRAMFGVTFGMLTANLRIGEAFLIIWIVVLVHRQYLF